MRGVSVRPLLTANQFGQQYHPCSLSQVNLQTNTVEAFKNYSLMGQTRSVLFHVIIQIEITKS